MRSDSPHPTGTDARFQEHRQALIEASKVVIESPAGSTHRRFPDFVYPYDYGILERTDGGDGEGIDVWVGSVPDRRLVGAIVTVVLVSLYGMMSTA